MWDKGLYTKNMVVQLVVQLENEEFLNAFPPTVQLTVRLVIPGDEAPPSTLRTPGFALRPRFQRQAE